MNGQPLVRVLRRWLKRRTTTSSFVGRVANLTALQGSLVARRTIPTNPFCAFVKITKLPYHSLLPFAGGQPGQVLTATPEPKQALAAITYLSTLEAELSYLLSDSEELLRTRDELPVV
jgi:hypothetical protein